MRRVLALSGGGLRGVIEVAFLEAVEAAYQERFGPETRLCDIFDLVGGTSTGALIAAAVSLGKPVSEIADFYRNRATLVFRRGRRWQMAMAPVFDAKRLEAEIRREVGDMTLGDSAIRTRLAIVMKRLDTASPWIVSNIASSPFYDDPRDGNYIGNRHYHLARLLRASAAAPIYFRQQTIDIASESQPGVFVDGGVSPFNDPSLALLKLARMRAFGLRWPLGPDDLFILSLGAGYRRPRLAPERAARAGPLRTARDSLRGVLHDAECETVTMMAWMGRCLVPFRINSEIENLEDDDAFDEPMFSYLRLNLPLEKSDLDAAGLDVGEAELARLSRFGDPSTVEPLYKLAREYCARQHDLKQVLP